MSIEKDINNEGTFEAPEEHNEGDPYYGTDEKTVIGVWFKQGGKWRVDHFDVPLTDADRKAMETMSDKEARDFLIKKAQENKSESIN